MDFSARREKEGRAIKVVRTVEEMKALSREIRQKGQRLGFVPTMGFFHEGHLALMRYARPRCDQLVVSLFVNPIQFGPREDFREYPRDFERDAKLAQGEGVDILFAPEAEDMYPQGFQTYVEVTELSKPLCGAKRPWHFRGVATVVLKLFNIVNPHFAVFGLKDYQQFLVIRQMVRDLNLDIEILGHPIVREPDGLAMSSRNIYLSPEERKSALCLYQALELAKRRVAEGVREVAALTEELSQFISSHPYTRIDYIEFRHPETLAEVTEIKGPTLLALAVFVGRARLIDNAIIGQNDYSIS